MVSDFGFLLLEADLTFLDQLLDELGRMKDFDIRFTVIHPGAVTRGTGKNDPFCPLLFHFFQIVLDQSFGIVLHPCRNQGKTTAPLLPSQNGKINFGLIQNLDKGLRDPLRHREIRCNTPNEIDDLCLFPLKHILGNLGQGVYPGRPVLIRFTDNVMDSF